MGPVLFPKSSWSAGDENTCPDPLTQLRLEGELQWKCNHMVQHQGGRDIQSGLGGKA
jgi:hypothetical protein